MSNRRGKILMTTELMMDLLGLPGATLRGLEFDPSRDICTIHVAHESLESVPEGAESPEVQPWDITMYPEAYKSSKS